MSNKLFDVRVMLPDVYVKVVASDESQAMQLVSQNLDYEMIGELSDDNFSVARSEDVSSEYSFDANKVGITSDFEVRPDIEEIDESVEGYERGLYSRF